MLPISRLLTAFDHSHALRGNAACDALRHDPQGQRDRFFCFRRCRLLLGEAGGSADMDSYAYEFSIVPTLCVGMQPVTLCVTIHWARVIGSSAFGAAACRLLLAEADSIADG